VPLLSGRLGGSRLGLVDLAPALGLAAAGDAAAPKPVRRRGKVVPDRPFDLAALRVMDADVLVDIAEVDLNSRYIEPLRPLHTRIELRNGVLSLHELDARTAQGSFSGLLRLDGRDHTAKWSTRLRWDGLRVERWIAQGRDKSVPPWVSGQLSGHASLAGQGRSTAEILASLQGSARTELRDGKVSHLGVEAAGLDVAQGLWVWLKGDDALPVNCAVADLTADKGVFKPRMMVVDTASSAIWVEGTLSLATEALDLRAVVSPKDFSPLSLRSPLRVQGSFAAPVVTVDLQRMAPRVAAAVLLALVNPLAAVIPLLDPGDAEAAQRGAVGCQGLLARHQAQNAKAKAGANAGPAVAKGKP
jgi:uncharacterized protein involved in outer membrane biogenesis